MRGVSSVQFRSSSRARVCLSKPGKMIRNRTQEPSPGLRPTSPTDVGEVKSNQQAQACTTFFGASRLPISSRTAPILFAAR